MGFNAYEFDEIARNVFTPAYPLLADQIIAKTGVTSGNCLDLGSGGGYLGLSIAETTALQVYLLDESEDMRNIATANISKRNLDTRVRAVTGDAHNIPLPNASMNLVISRSSLFFWKDCPQAFREIIRVLTPGGCAYVGGGFGSKRVRDKIVTTMRLRDSEWVPKYDRNRDDLNYATAIRSAGIADYEMTRDESGFWITFRKQPLMPDMKWMALESETMCALK